jgi:hypothetical protein
MLTKFSRVAAAMLLFAPSLFAQDITTAAYLTARNQATAEIQNNPEHVPEDMLEAREKQALDRLQAMLRHLVGPIRIQGFPGSGSISLETLMGDLGYGKLDGLSAKSFDGRTDALVSTVPLLKAWLGEHSDSWEGKPAGASLDIAKSFVMEDFYTQVFQDDSYYYLFAELPVIAHHQHSFARAVLYENAQDFVAPNPPENIAVSVVVGNTVFVLKERTTTGQMAACKVAYDQDSALADAAFASYRASQLKDQAEFKKYTDLQEVADSNFRHCFQQHLTQQPYYTDLVKQAQSLVDRIEE